MLNLGLSLIYNRAKTPTIIKNSGFGFNLFLGSRHSDACLNDLNLTGDSPKVHLPVMEGSDVEVILGASFEQGWVLGQRTAGASERCGSSPEMAKQQALAWFFQAGEFQDFRLRFVMIITPLSVGLRLCPHYLVGSLVIAP